MNKLEYTYKSTVKIKFINSSDKKNILFMLCLYMLIMVTTSINFQ